MSPLSIDAKPIPLEDLLNSVADGTAVLPAFQRDFDWSDSDVISLLATLISDWPAGSLLLMNGRPEFFQIRGFEDGPDLAENVRYVVLDGQQRLTALFKALRGMGDSVFALDAKALADSPGSAEDVEECIKLVSRAKWRKEYDLARQSQERLVPLFVLKSASDFFAWRDKVVDATPDADRGEVGKLYADVYRSHLTRLNTYGFPAVLLDNSLPPAAVARIFERINRTGLRLSTFDLLVARVYDEKWNLRERWETARREREPIAHWLKDDGLPVVQSIALNLEHDVRQPALLNLKPRDIRGQWDSAVDSVESAIRKLRELGVPAPNWMPYKGLLLPLAERATVLGAQSLHDDEGALATWFWGRSFGMNYDVGSSTRIAGDARLLSKGELEWAENEFTVDRDLVLGATRRQQSALWSAFLALLSSQSPRDLLTGDVIEEPFEDAVPVSLFPRIAGESSLHLRVLGLVLLTRESAKALRKDHGLFLSSVQGTTHASQLLPAGSLLSMISAPDAFFRSRLDLLQAHLDGLSSTPIFWTGTEGTE